MGETTGSTWAGNHHYRAAGILHPRDTGEVQSIVRRGTPVRALGSRHSFSDIADTAGELVSLDAFDPRVAVDPTRRTASFSGGLQYGVLARELQRQGWALHNLASLPHISVAGAVATGTHGSGDRNGSLATAVAALELVDGTGELVRFARGDRAFDGAFDGAVVSLGALGIVTRVTLDVEPTFDVRQDVYRDLPWDALLGNLEAVTGSAYSVSLFTDWRGDRIGALWLKSRTDAAAPPDRLLGATRLVADRHMIEDMPATNTTQQGGVPGPWNERLAHFRMGFTPSRGDELQSEFHVPRARALRALAAVRELAEDIAPVLHVTELRTVAEDRLWLSGAYGTDVLSIHFTWKDLPDDVAPVLAEVERRLLPLGARPHWGKMFGAEVDALEQLYPRLDDFRALARRHDPEGLFRNAWLARKLGL